MGLLLLNAALRLALSVRPLDFLDDLAIPDDAYLSLTIARNIARGLGPLYGLAPTNGFQPLYVFLMAPVYALFPGDPEAPIRVAFVLLTLFDTLTLVLLVRLASRLTTSRIAPWVMGLAWAIHPYTILTSLNALETSIAACFLAALLLAIDRLRDPPGLAASPRTPLAIGILLGLGALARIDLLLMAPVIAGVYLARLGRARGGWLRAVGYTAVGALIVYLPWLVYSWHWTHDVFPVSGRALRYITLSSYDHRPTLEGFYLPLLRRALDVVARKNAVPLALVAALGIGLLASRPRVSSRELLQRLARIGPALGFAALLLTAYVGVVFGSWHFARYFFPLTLPILLLLATLIDLWASAVPHGLRRAALAAALAALVIVGSAAHPAFRRMWAREFGGTWGYRRIGLWTRDHFPPGATVGGSQTGAIGYFADRLRVVNLDGVVNRECYDAMREGRMLDYLRRAGVRDLVWQDDIEFLSRETRRGPPATVTRIRRIEGFETWGAPWYLYRVETP